jgi:hypothetical protein
MLDVFLWDEDAYVLDITLCEKPALVGHKCNGTVFHDVTFKIATPHPKAMTVV